MFEKSIMVINKIQNLIKTTVAASAFPFTCVLCKSASDREQDLCRACLEDLPIITQNCSRCAQKIQASSTETEQELSCGACLNNPPPFTTSYSLFAYEAPVTSLILGLKFQQQLAYARILGELMATDFRQKRRPGKAWPELLIPVPLHPKRLKERGFNQALELARPLGQALGIPIDTTAVRRLKDTAPQMELPAEERRRNIKNAFVVEKKVSGKRIAVLDDVMTTGSTLSELAACLLQQGAREVEAWCCARA